MVHTFRPEDTPGTMSMCSVRPSGARCRETPLLSQDTKGTKDAEDGKGT